MDASWNQRRFLMAAGAWLVTQSVISSVSSAVMLSQGPAKEVMIHFFFVPTVVSALQIASTAGLLRRIRSRSKAIYVGVGAFLAFVIPIGFYVPIAALALARFSYFIAVGTVMFMCAPSQLVG